MTTSQELQDLKEETILSTLKKLKEENKALKDEIEYYKKMKQGIVMFLSGRQICASTFIDDETITYGYGDLDRIGCWEYSVPSIIVKYVQELREKIKLLENKS